QLRYWIPVFLDCTQSILQMSELENVVTQIDLLKDTLFEKVTKYIDSKGCKPNNELQELLRLDLQVCAMGLIDYFHKNEQKA
ncbi:hypothetical protein, partial [Actinocorallia longicatena]